MSDSGAGSLSVRPGFDVARVKREGGGAGNLIVVNQSGTVLATFSGAARARHRPRFRVGGRRLVGVVRPI